MADFRKQEGLVYKEFRRDLHLYKDKEIDESQYLGGIDFGFTNPTGIVCVKKDNRGVYWVSDEYYEKEKTDAQIAEVVQAYQFNKVYPDPENPGAIKEMKERGVNCCEVNKGKDSVTNGIQKIRELMLQGRLKISVNCVNLIFEFEQYHYPVKAVEGNEKELPVKENDHLLDALRYIILMDAQTVEIKQYNTWLTGIARESQPNPAR